MDALVTKLHSHLCGALAALVRVATFQRPITGGRQGHPRGSPTGLEATGPSAKALRRSKGHQPGGPRNRQPTAAVVRTAAPIVPPPAHARNHRSKERDQVKQLLNAIQLQNKLLTLLFLLFTFHCLTPFAAAQPFPSAPEHIIAFDEIGQMAASMAYIHVAIPLNISTYQHQCTLFDSYLKNFASKTTPDPNHVSFTKAIRDLATFAYKRLDKLIDKLRFIDVVLPSDDFSQPLNGRQKRFLDLWLHTILRLDGTLAEYEKYSIDGDAFDANCDLKNSTHNLTSLYPFDFRPTRTGKQLLPKWHSLLKEKEKLRRQELLLCHLRKQQTTTTTPAPYPDYPDFHEVFSNDTYPSTTSTTTPAPSFHAAFPTLYREPPPSPYLDRHTRDTSQTYQLTPDDANSDDNYRDERQILAAIGAIGGVLGTVFGLFNQVEMHNIENHVSKLEASQNMLIQVAHKNTQNLKNLNDEMTHLGHIIDTLIRFNPALVHAKLMSQVEDVADHLDALLDTVQQLQHQRLSIKLLDLHQLHILFASIKATALQNQWTLLIKNPQDIFQLDVSYIRKDSDVVIMVHVPCLTDNHLLTIYRYANLPLPINALLTSPTANSTLQHLQHIHTINDLVSQFSNPLPAQEALYLLPETDLIAIGRNDGSSHRYKLLTHADLAGCVQRNHVFLCEGHQVLRTDLEGSCLGSLYLQSQEGVRENCKLERKQLRETVFQVSATDHLVVSPYPHTSQITCNNGTHYPIRIQTTSRIRVNPGCSLTLFNHTLRSDQSVRIKPEPLLFSWAFNPLSLPSELLSEAKHLDDQVNLLKSSIADINNVTVTDSEIPQLIEDTLSTTSTFSILFWTVMGIAVLALTLLVCWYCGSRRRQTSRSRTLRPDELPMTISQIAGLNLPDADGRR